MQLPRAAFAIRTAVRRTPSTHVRRRGPRVAGRRRRATRQLRDHGGEAAAMAAAGEAGRAKTGMPACRPRASHPSSHAHLDACCACDQNTALRTIADGNLTAAPADRVALKSATGRRGLGGQPATTGAQARGRSHTSRAQGPGFRVHQDSVAPLATARAAPAEASRTASLGSEGNQARHVARRRRQSEDAPASSRGHSAELAPPRAESTSLAAQVSPRWCRRARSRR